MKLDQSHLTYCTNVHAGESWPEVLSSLRTHVRAVKAAVQPQAPFGVGLRLSAAAAEQLDDAAALDDFEAFLEAEGLYVFTLNGFPYGPFHGEPVKRAVYRPDWRQAERGRYTERLVRILARVLPSGLVGSISTVPGGFRGDVTEPAELDAVARHLLDQVAALHQLRDETGTQIALSLEPEPRCLLETTPETVSFFEERLLSAGARRVLAERLGLSSARAEEIVRRHLGVCLDTCHAAIEFEEPDDTIERLVRAGIGIFKIQLSTGLALVPGADTLAALGEYDEPVYLHQVVARLNDGRLLRFDDLPEALSSPEAREASEWRVHFHVPVFRRDLGTFENTQPYLSRILQRQRQSALSPHLEVETYTWDVLPAAQREGGVVASISRELEWVRERLASDAGS